MFSQLKTCVVVAFIFSLIALAVWGCDRMSGIHWLGSTTLKVEFHVVAADTNEPIPEARVHVESYGGFYEGGDGEKPFDLQANASGIARRQLNNNWCIGTNSGLGFTRTRYVYIPDWSVKALAAGFQPSDSISLWEYRGKALPEGPQKDKLTVQIALKRANAP